MLALGAGLVALAAGCGTEGGPRRPAAARFSMVVAGPYGGGADRLGRFIKGDAEQAALVAGLDVVNRPDRTALGEFVGPRPPGRLLIAEPAMIATMPGGRRAGAFAGTTPLARLCGEWELLVVPAGSRLRSFDAFADVLRRDPARLVLAGRAAGGVDHMLFGLLAESLGVDPRLLRYAPHSSTGQAVAALAAGRVAAVVAGRAGLGARLRAGDLRVLAVSAPHRLGGVDAPTLLECDVHLYYADWRALIGTGRLPAADQDALTRMCREITSSARWRRMCRHNGWSPIYLDGEDFRQWLRVECARLGRVLDDLGARA
ncbi:C4-dicarboxylate ABC transporter substrate-binding protein [Sphaerisporangium rufum]|uniref:C4-dicarboxylate ABC transporter substrate-binding protein n=1 Tax=Sphaerisporangium rufum TaxID=1381558 RepID=A0A919R5Y5_9ACTN|nr:C4-dicarboxylate ABC transporter substrate-binding protein [Sphaerisporangium rufum]